MSRDKIDMSPDEIDTWTNYLCQNYDSEVADAAYDCCIEGEDVEVTKASRLIAISTFAKSTIASMRSREISTKKRILCGYTSTDQVLQHARRMGSICLLAGTPRKEGALQLSLDRSLDAMHHYPVECLLISAYLNVLSLHTQPPGPGKHLHSTFHHWMHPSALVSHGSSNVHCSLYVDIYRNPQQHTFFFVAECILLLLCRMAQAMFILPPIFIGYLFVPPHA